MTARTPAEAFLAAFHDALPGCTSRAFGTAHEGPTGYDRLVAAVPADARAVLDLACGDGFLLAALAAARPDAALAGVDLSAGELAAARERLGDRADLCQARAQALPFADAAFDAVTCHMALMLMDEVPAVLAEARRVLRPGGVFAAVVSGASDPSPARDVFRRLRQDPGRVAPHPPLGDRRVEQDPAPLLRAAGFADVALTDFSFPIRRGPEGLWEAFAEMYPIGALDAGEQARMAAAYVAEVTPLLDPDGELALPWGLRLIVAT